MLGKELPNTMQKLIAQVNACVSQVLFTEIQSTLFSATLHVTPAVLILLELAKNITVILT